MPDTLTTITKLIHSPPGQLAAGGLWQAVAIQFGLGLGLFYGVTKFFDVVGDRLNDDTKLEIAVWLLGVKVGQKLEPWPDTFAKVFDRVFGKNHLSWRCVWRSCVISYVLLVFAAVIYTQVRFPSGHFIRGLRFPGWPHMAMFFGITLFTNVLPDYLSLLESRFVLRLMARTRSGGVWTGGLVLDVWLTLLIAFLPILILSGVLARRFDPLSVLRAGWSSIRHPFDFTRDVYGYAVQNPVVIFPAFFTSIWLWLYAGSGFLLKAARRFDIGFDWFNRHFDIEKKPLQSIGLVAGALVAVVYWVAVVVSRVVG
jgi:hypothetical protein